MADQCYRIAFVPLDAFGHVNACLGLARDLRQRGHNCVFIANQNWKDLIEKHGFEYKIYIEEHKLGNKGWNDFMIQYGYTLKLSSFEKIRAFEAPVWPTATQDVKLFNDKIKEILNQLKVDAIIVDSFISIPAVVTASVPWIDLCSCNPVFYYGDERLPPGGSGYPTNGDKNLWKKFRDEAIDAYSKEWNSYNSWLESKGAPLLDYGTRFQNKSPFLNIYLNPEELKYENLIFPKECPGFAIDALIRTDVENGTSQFQIPEKLRDKQGKLIYLSMGTLCCSELNLMRRLVSILKKSKHRFIISKGPLGDQLELTDNMWGQNSVPQLQILPFVDLVLTHGGNNTVTESLYFGKPMIVLPVFGDQYDNAQIITEKGLGIRLDPYFCEENELLEAIEKLVNDSVLKEKYQKISERIQKSRSREQAAELIEDIIAKRKSEKN